MPLSIADCANRRNFQPVARSHFNSTKRLKLYHLTRLDYPRTSMVVFVTTPSTRIKAPFAIPSCDLFLVGRGKRKLEVAR